MVLSEIAKVTLPPSPPLSVAAMVKRSVCRRSCRLALRPWPALLGEQDVGELVEIDLALGLAELQVEPIAGLAAFELA